MTNNRLSVGCWNIGSMISNLDKNSKYVLDIITKYSPDIMCFQEFPDNAKTREQILMALDVKYSIFEIISESHVAPNTNMGLFVCSKYELSHHETIQLPKPQVGAFRNGKEEFWHDKSFLKTSFFFNGKNIALITGHGFPFYRYGLNEYEHSYVYQGVDAWIDAFSEQVKLIAADFNSSCPIRHLPKVSHNHIDAFFNIATRPSGRKTDAIILPKWIEVTNAINISGDFDHNFLMIDLKI